MNEIVKAANRLKLEMVVKNLKKRNMRGYYCENTEEAKKLLEDMILKVQKEQGHVTVGWGGSATVDQIGIKEWLAIQKIKTIDPYTDTTPEESMEKRRLALGSDIFLMSSNAVTLEGELLNIDGTGNRVAALCFGPKHVIVAAGANKVVRSLGEGMDRVKNCACPANGIRLKKETPCALTGKCTDCLIPGETICANTVTTRFSYIKDRIQVILINEDLGF